MTTCFSTVETISHFVARQIARQDKLQDKTLLFMKTMISEELSTAMKEDDTSVFLEKPLSLKKKWRLPRRYVVALLLGLAVTICYFRRNNLSFVLFYSLYLSEIEEKRATHISNVSEWNSMVDWMHYGGLRVINEIFDVGVMIAEIPAAFLVMRYSAPRVLFFSMAISSVLHMTLVVGFKSPAGGIVTLLINFLLGISQAPLFPACIGVLLQWSPQTEKTQLGSIVFSGLYIGLVFGGLLSSYLTMNFDGEIIFYLSGVVGLIWCLVWTTNFFEFPNSDPFITKKELDYLEENTDRTLRAQLPVKTIPLRSILTSLPMYSICISFFCFFACDIICQLGAHYSIPFDDHNDEFLLSILYFFPLVLMPFFIAASGFIVDGLLRKTGLTTTTARKIFCCGPFLLHGIFILTSAFKLSGYAANFIVINIGTACLAVSMSGFAMNCLDISPRYAIIVVAIARTFGCIGDMMAMILLIYFRWNVLAYVSFSLSVLAALTFGVFSSGNLQPWANAQ